MHKELEEETWSLYQWGANKSNQVSSRTSLGSSVATSSNCPHFHLCCAPTFSTVSPSSFSVGSEMKLHLVELEHEPLALVELIASYTSQVFYGTRQAYEQRGVPTDAILIGVESSDGGIDPAKMGRIVDIGKGEGRLEGLLNLLGMADAGANAPTALEHEDITEAGAVIEAVEANEQGVGGGGEGVRG